MNDVTDDNPYDPAAVSEAHQEDAAAPQRALAKLSSEPVPCGKEGFNGHRLCSRGWTGSHTCIRIVPGHDLHTCRCGFDWTEE